MGFLLGVGCPLDGRAVQSARFQCKSGAARPGGAEPEGPVWGRAVRHLIHHVIISQFRGTACLPTHPVWFPCLAEPFAA